MPLTDCRRLHPLHGRPRQVAGRVEGALGRVTHLTSAQQQVVCNQCCRPFHPRLRGPAPTSRVQYCAEMLGPEGTAQLPRARGRVLLPHAFERRCQRASAPRELGRDLAARLP
eukprot:2617430-Pleurochrysis_carterae.AAC.2